MTSAVLRPAAPLRKAVQKTGPDVWIMRAMLYFAAGFLLLFVLMPLWAMLSKSFTDGDGLYIGLANYFDYFATPALSNSIYNSITISLLVTVIVVPMAFLYAYGLTRTCMRFKGIYKALAMAPLLAPSLLPAISLVYLFGNQGIFKDVLMGESIYGPIGIVLGMCFYVFPHALLILLTALSTSDARLYEAAQALGAKPTKMFLSVTLPGVRYGLISAVFVVFTLVITDFGVPKVIGGQYNVLATDIYKQVVGQQNFNMGAVVGMILLVPACLAFFADQMAQRRQVSQLSSRAVPYQPKIERGRDRLFLIYCSFVSLFILMIVGIAAWASLIKFWPYDFTLVLKNYDFNAIEPNGWQSYTNSLEFAALTALFGSLFIFTTAYLVEKGRKHNWLRNGLHALAMVPLAVPGMVLGLSYIFFFNAPDNPLNFLYSTMAILVLSTVAHFYTVSHLTAITALKQIDPEIEAVSQSLKVPFYKTFFKVTLPVCLPTVLDIAIYLFVNAMTTVSAVVFLYAPDTKLASIAVLNMDDVGDTAPAAAMAMMIFMTALAVRLLYSFMTRKMLRRTQAWRFK
ncbi:putative 2-aminoethylphosphonate ABC transporter permease subunit [Terasakiella pusilla]|uniref:putative 2-aminoethylphosphonate ABC transporter permease subunit n=1 Tax=Terasakiella pusilla TaxID=64973 RepID=UPI00048F0A52|nr:putative 2-aminoethylphosphonate ABC transporter permease subunit [Terasakiella pusilla]